MARRKRVLGTADVEAGASPVLARPCTAGGGHAYRGRVVTFTVGRGGLDWPPLEATALEGHLGTVAEDARAVSEWIAKSLSAAGYRADFLPGSLWEIDRFFDEQSRRGRAKADGFLAEDVESCLFALGAYVGEVIRRSRGGEWRGESPVADLESKVELVLTGGAVCRPLEQVTKRFKNGPGESISAYALSLGLDAGPRPAPPSPHWWKFW